MAILIYLFPSISKLYRFKNILKNTDLNLKLDSMRNTHLRNNYGRVFHIHRIEQFEFGSLSKRQIIVIFHTDNYYQYL